MKFEFYTAAICFLGWLLSWLLRWAAEWKTKRSTLFDYVEDNPPAFYISIVGTLVIYMIGPSILPVVGIVFPSTVDSVMVKRLFAFVVGYMSDSLIYKMASILPKREQ